MRLILILTFLICTSQVYSQADPMRIKNLLNGSVNSFTEPAKTINDTIPTVKYETTNYPDPYPAYYINGRFVLESIINTIDPHHIEKINLVKEEIEVDKIKYYGQIYIQLKKDYTPKLISLTDLKSKYLSKCTSSAIFMVDNAIINGDYSKYIVDEKYILSISVIKVENKEGNFQVDVIRLLTRTTENIKKANQIKIRGTEDFVVK